MGKYDDYLLKRGLHERTTKAVDERSMKRRQNRRYYEGYFLELLNLKRKASFSPAPDGTPVWWEKRANKQYLCKVCSGIISKGERYIGCRKLSLGMRGRYGHRGTYRMTYYHILCILEATYGNAENRIKDAVSEISNLEGQIASLKETALLRKDQIKHCETAKQKAKSEYDTAKSFRRLLKWISHKYTFFSKNREIRNLRTEIGNIEVREIPSRESAENDLSKSIKSLRSWQQRLKKESEDFSKLQ